MDEYERSFETMKLALTGAKTGVEGLLVAALKPPGAAAKLANLARLARPLRELAGGLCDVLDEIERRASSAKNEAS